MPFVALDVSGERYGRLVAVKRVANRGRATFWSFRCDCGKTTEAALGAVRSGDIQSCGCWKAESFLARAVHHGMAGSRTYLSWSNAKARCYNPKNKRFADYGGRGIAMCDRWRASFEAFLSDMGERPHGMTLDRKDVNGNYEPGNCRWATQSEQTTNTRNQKWIEVGGERLSLKQFAEREGVDYKSLWSRVRKTGRDPFEAVAAMRRGKWAPVV